MEIVHVSIHRCEDSTACPSSSGTDFGSIQLQGLKITGDPNVPANKLSFCINLTDRVNVNEIFLEDDRPVVIFPSTGPIVIDLESRIPHMGIWARGYGQINRNPPIWQPEWVSCAIITYRQPLSENQTQFTILWKDEGSFYRHAMDFHAVQLDHLPNPANVLDVN
jgi:hypothetical protein